MFDVFEKLGKIGIVPVVVLDDPAQAEPVGRALSESGLKCAEVTFRTAAAEESIKIMTELFPDLLVGAGTVLTVDQADRAINAGARFIVAPGLNPKVVKYTLDNGVPMAPGIQTPTEIEQAMEFGLDAVKFFPAEPAGGLKMIKALAAPYVNMKFMPTGGLNAENVRDYLGYEKIFACGGSWMVKGALIREGKYDEIKRLSAEAVQIVKEVRG